MPLFDLSFLTPEIRAVQAMHQARLEMLWRGEQPETVLALDGLGYGRSHGLGGINETDMLTHPRDWLAEVIADMAAKADRLADPLTYRPPVIEIDPLGVHFIDALFGAQTRFFNEQVWSEELSIDLDELQPVDFDASPLYAQAAQLTELAVEATQGKLYLTTPVLACVTNIAINLFGERILVALHERPASAARALGIINAAIVEATRRFYALIPAAVRRNSVACNRLAPAGVGQFDGCSTQLVSGRDYARFFGPLDADLTRLFERGGLMHICGAHTQHIPAWRAMPGLRAVQLNDRAMDDLPAFYAGLRPDTLFYLYPSAAVPVERIMEITGGRRVILETTVEQPIPVCPQP